MIILKPNWVSHADPKGMRGSIYAIDVHPDGRRLATGGLDCSVKIWNTEPIMNEAAEKDPNCHKLLCTMTSHGGAVLCVRWSHDGKYLASSSDTDNVIIIWEHDKEAGSSAVFGSTDVNHETWRAIKYLRGHESDVQDLAWSKDDKYLASCGVDGFIIVWDPATSDQVKKIDEHSGFVKGVTWDPVGKYLATQSDDKTLKIWRTTDWGLEHIIKEPFINAPGTTLFRRLSWSPDGSYIAAANATNANQCISAIIYRDDWAANFSLIGHDFPIEVTSTNPKLFYVKENSDSTLDDAEQSETLASICALGDQKGCMSIWVTKQSRPLCVVTDTFEKSVYDLAWTPDGKGLFACSGDGTIIHMQLDDYLLRSASDEEIIKGLSQYGYGRRNVSLPETPTQLDLEEHATAAKTAATKRMAELMGTDPQAIGVSSSTQPAAPVASIASTLPPAQPAFSAASSSSSTIVHEQKVTVGKDGKRRIQPVMVRNTTSATPSSTTADRSTAKTSEPLATQTSRANANTARLSAKETVEYDSPGSIPQSGIGSAVIGNKRKVKEPEEDSMDIDSGETRILDTGATHEPRRRPSWVDSAVIPPVVSHSKVQLGVPKVKSTLQRKQSSMDTTILMECHNPKAADDVNYAKLIVSSKGTILWTDYVPSAILLMDGNNTFSATGCEDGTIHVYSSAGRRLFPPIVLESTPVILHCAEEWLLCLTATGLIYTWNISSQKSSLSAISIAPILRVAQIETSKTPKPAPTIKDVRIHRNGIPLLITNYQQAFAYDFNMNAWMRVSDAWYILSEFWDPHGRPGTPILDPNPLGWLSTAMSTADTTDSTRNTLVKLANLDSTIGNSVTISHLETQLAVAVLLDSAEEYEEWMYCYARRLSKENAQGKVEELCRWLLGPPYIPCKKETWKPTVLGTLSKHELLGKVLSILGQNRLFQRIVSDYREAL